MKKSKWLLELDLFTDTELNLIDAIKRSGREVQTLKYVPFDDKLISNIENKYDEGDCVVFYGSLNLGKKLLKSSFIPGVYLDMQKFECLNYYPVFGDELLHKNYLMMPFGDIMRRKSELFELFGEDLFIRPSSGFKNFTGTVLNKYNFDYGIELASFYDIEPNLLCVISNAKQIVKEWRFVIVNNEAISGSLYRDWTSGPEILEPDATTRDLVLRNSKSVLEYCNDEKAFEYANKVAKLYSPNDAWTIDVTLTSEGEYKVIEIGSFSCAGLYANDLDKVVEKVSEAAEKEWQEYQIDEIQAVITREL